MEREGLFTRATLEARLFSSSALRAHRQKAEDIAGAGGTPARAAVRSHAAGTEATKSAGNAHELMRQRRRFPRCYTVAASHSLSQHHLSTCKLRYGISTR